MSDHIDSTEFDQNVCEFEEDLSIPLQEEHIRNVGGEACGVLL